MKLLSFPFPKSYHGMIVKYKSWYSCYLYYGRIENHNTIVWFKTNNKHYPVLVSTYNERNIDRLTRYKILE
jgi:hypothetical protein